MGCFGGSNAVCHISGNKWLCSYQYRCLEFTVEQSFSGIAKGERFAVGDGSRDGDGCGGEIWNAMWISWMYPAVRGAFETWTRLRPTPFFWVSRGQVGGRRVRVVCSERRSVSQVEWTSR